MSSEYLDWLNDLRNAPHHSKAYNQWLCITFPWLRPRNIWKDTEIDDYDYDYTLLDDMPDGWYEAFGEKMCFELKAILEEADYEQDYRVIEIKEKFGGLRWYDNGAPASIYKKIQDVIYKYESISYKTCVSCGAPADGLTTGWVMPFCQHCADAEKFNIVPFTEESLG